MKTYRWEDLNHKIPPARREQIGREALAELDRMGFAALRKARELTQVEVAERLGIDQAGVSALENRSDLLLSTLAKYIRAMGGEVEIVAVFPEASFNLEPLPPLGDPVEMRRPRPVKRKPAAKKPAQPRRRAAVAAARA